MPLPADFGNHRECLKAMVWELQNNRTILDELSNCYKMFLFTGGDVPRQSWGLVALTSYLERSFAVGCISTEEVQCYCNLATVIMELGQELAEAKPRTLRCRKNIADTFDQAASEIRTLERSLESAMTKLLEPNMMPLVPDVAAADA